MDRNVAELQRDFFDLTKNLAEIELLVVVIMSHGAIIGEG